MRKILLCLLITTVIQICHANDYSRIELGSIDLFEAARYTGNDKTFINVLGSFDINQDGYLDFVIGQFRHFRENSPTGRKWEPSGEIKPVVLFFDNAKTKYFANQQIQNVIKPAQHPRQVAFIDVNQDQLIDIFIADHGYDDAPYGNQNGLIMQVDNGWVDATDLLPQFTDFSHGLVTGNFNEDQIEDLLILNNRVSTKSKCDVYPELFDCPSSKKFSNSYTLSPSPDGVLLPGKLSIPENGFSNNVINFDRTPKAKDKRLYVGHSEDLNDDSIDDLIISNHKDFYVILSDGSKNGQFADTLKYGPANVEKNCKETPVSAIETLDLDGNGFIEIIVAQTCDLKSSFFRVLETEDKKVWRDATDKFVGSQERNTNGEAWCYKFQKADLDSDGKLDLICQSSEGYREDGGNVFWLNKSGKLESADLILPGAEWTNFHTHVSSPDGPMIVGFQQGDKKTEPNLLRIYGWILNPGNVGVKVDATTSDTADSKELKYHRKLCSRARVYWRRGDLVNRWVIEAKAFGLDQAYCESISKKSSGG